MNEIAISDFNLEYTLECGQAFRWERQDGWYYGVVNDFLVRLHQEDTRLLYEISGDMDVKNLYHYLALDLDLPFILNTIDVDEHIHSAITAYRGLRILRQEPWECLASFILSSYNNIPRIKQMIHNLAMRFGKPIRLDDFVSYTFPSVDSIANATLKQLDELRFGFRTDYLLEAARKIANGHLCLDTIRDSNYSIAKSYLLTIPGVGDKVADCILLFSMEKYESFPVDVWIGRTMERLYFDGNPTNPRTIGSFARDYFGKWAGYAQEYLYCYARDKRYAQDPIHCA